MKEVNLTKSLVWLTLILVLISGVTYFAQADDYPLAAVGVEKTEFGLGVSATTPVSFGEVKWMGIGQRKVENERYSYKESNYFSLEGILYPGALSVQGFGMRLKLGAGLKGFGESSLHESWTGGQYFEQTELDGGAYLLGSVQAAICLNLSRGVEQLALTEGATPEPAPFWSLLDPFWFVVDFQAGPGWTTQKPYLKFKGEATAGLEYRF